MRRPDPKALASLLLLLAVPLFAAEQWMGVYLGTAKIGYGYLSVEEVDGRVRVFETLSMGLKMLGQDKSLNTVTNATTDPEMTLESFDFELKTGDQVLSFDGSVEDGVLIVRGGQPGSDAKRFPLTHPLYLGATLEAAAVLNRLPEGSIQVFDPSTLSMEVASLTHRGREPLEHGGETLMAYVYGMDYLGTMSLSWVHGDRLLRQESPMDIVTVEEPMEVATRSGAAVDLLRFFSVQPKGLESHPRDLRWLRMRLRDVDPSLLDLSLASQSILSLFEDGAEIVVESGSSEPPRGITPIPDSVLPYLDPTEGIQCDDPEISALARSIAGDEGGTGPRVRKILEWVYHTLEKRPTVTLPSALDVLRLGYGDCNEHSILFAALARAAGIPSDVTVGLVYHNGAYYYHAWNVIWFENRWEFVDPIQNQFPVPPDHILLKRGGLAKQAQIVPVVGRIEIDVLEYED
jgi:hypothetical protein